VTGSGSAPGRRPDGKPPDPEEFEAGHQDVDPDQRESAAGERAPSAGQRNTRQRGALSALLAEVPDFHSAQDLHSMLRGRGERIGLTTVYRTLQALADAGEVDVMRSAAGEHLYRRCSDGHHHHLVCRSCGRTVEVLGPTVESWAERVAVSHGYVDVSHTLEIFGTCPACAERVRHARGS
jgi:Fur family ferric uptake transcriptional regulator